MLALMGEDRTQANRKDNVVFPVLIITGEAANWHIGNTAVMVRYSSNQALTGS